MAGVRERSPPSTRRRHALSWHGAELVDAGDYDAGGWSEVVFWHSGYDEDGYSLLYRQFHERTDFFWIYH
jgi:hypothetical protein